MFLPIPACPAGNTGKQEANRDHGRRRRGYVNAWYSESANALLVEIRGAKRHERAN
ncbi:hypothetical protein AKJ09_11202 [Labilithrix luteola]|uniref:Uncharacterized protein n=1 Tax=Labilithrix luteola TaxID=1391654 RepID=A0A0K1QFK0_9BACT|nr:hypothetical protein AKJ09_11202 [Labilithrix luteola]